MDRKKFTMLIISFFLAVIFIVSYSSILGYTVETTTSTTSMSASAAAYATGTANAMVTGYAPFLNITVKCKNSSETASVFSELSNSLALLEANNSVSVFLPVAHNISVDAGNANSLQIYEYEYSQLNTSSARCATFSTGEIITLPKQITLVVQSQKIPVALQNSSRRYTLQTTLSQNMSLVVPVKVSALLTQSGTLYGNLSVSRMQV